MAIEDQLKAIILERYKSIRAFTMEIDIPYSTLDTIFKRGIGGAGVSTVIKIFQALDLDIESISKGDLKYKSQKYHSRIQELRLEKGFPVKGVADALEIPLDVYQKYEKDEIIPDERTLLYIANFYGCSVKYVLGKSDSKIDDDESDSYDELSATDELLISHDSKLIGSLSLDEVAIIKKYRTLDERGRSMVNSVLSNALEWSKPTSQDE